MELSYHEKNESSKKRKVQRACDVCRRKKIRCYESVSGDPRCSNCITYDEQCTFNDGAQKRYPMKSYVSFLEEKVKRMEALLKQYCPEEEIAKEMSIKFDQSSGKTPHTTFSKSLIEPIETGTRLFTISSSSPEEDEYSPSDDEDLKGVYCSLQQLKLDPDFPRFYGRSSGAKLVQTALALRKDVTGVDPPSLKHLLQNMRNERPEVWFLHPWELKEPIKELPGSRFVFPDADLIAQLFDHYFCEFNTLFPVLHRLRLEYSFRQGLHLRDDRFANIVLLVCAIGARFSHDPRVCVEGGSNYSAGWKWYNQVDLHRNGFIAVGLPDIQLYTLAALFCLSSSTPQASWALVGIGLRCAQDLGAHRRRMYSGSPSLEDELWKRVFWVLVVLDRTFSMQLARPCVLQEEDFDAELPLLLDDEYWERPVESDSERSSRGTPQAGPSMMEAFICHIRLTQISAFALRTIYSINKSKMLHGFLGPEWEQKVVSELDSAINKWNNAIPDHLRWGPQASNLSFFHQSTSLYITYYQLQIAIHRPFIIDLTRQGTMTSSALAICTSAARSTSRVMDAHLQRRGVPLPIHLFAPTGAAMILYLSIWSGMRSGVMGDPQKAMADVHRCMKYLKYFEERWQIAGRGWQVLAELVRDSNPLPQYHTSTMLKRSRVEDNQGTQATATPISKGEYTNLNLASQNPEVKTMPRSFAQVRASHHDMPFASDHFIPHLHSQNSNIPSVHVQYPTTQASGYQPPIPPTFPPTSMPVFFSSNDWMADPVIAFDQMFAELYGIGFPSEPPQSGADEIHTMDNGSGLCNPATYASACPQMPAYPTQETFSSWTDGSTNWRFDG